MTGRPTLTHCRLLYGIRIFVDDDGQRYLYWGCSNVDPIWVRLNSKMQAITEPEILIRHNPDDYGWEVPGELMR